MKTNLFIMPALVCAALASCAGSGKTDDAERQEDMKAKQLFQGIWVDSDEENVVFRVKGDTIYYPDSLSQPVRFAIFGDTLDLQSANESKYIILKQSAHIFEFKNTNGDIVKLVKGTDPSLAMQFASKKTASVNQNKVVKSDSVVFCLGERYHSYIQVNPTTYKVYKTSYNDDGLETESVYFDNTVHISLFKNEQKVFSRDFKKSDFRRYVPKEFLRQSILSDITLQSAEGNCLSYTAQLAIPDSNVSYLVSISISTSGKTTMSVQK